MCVENTVAWHVPNLQRYLLQSYRERTEAFPGEVSSFFFLHYQNPCPRRYSSHAKAPASSLFRKQTGKRSEKEFSSLHEKELIEFYQYRYMRDDRQETEPFPSLR